MISRRRIAAAVLALALPAAVTRAQSLPPRPVDTDIKTALETAGLSMLFEGDSAEDFHDWESAFRLRLTDLLGDSTPPEKWTVDEEKIWEFDDHTRIALLLRADGIPSVPVYLLIPKKTPGNGKMPAVLCIHGHGNFGNDPVVGRTDIEGVPENIAKHHYDYGLQFVRRGYVVAAPCMIPFGRRVDRDKYGKNDPCAVAFVRMQAVGQLVVPVWDELFRDRLRRAYRSLSAEDHLRFDRFQGGHEWSGRVAFPLFDEVLKK